MGGVSQTAPTALRGPVASQGPRFANRTEPDPPNDPRGNPPAKDRSDRSPGDIILRTVVQFKGDDSVAERAETRGNDTLATIEFKENLALVLGGAFHGAAEIAAESLPDFFISQVARPRFRPAGMSPMIGGRSGTTSPGCSKSSWSLASTVRPNSTVLGGTLRSSLSSLDSFP